MASAAVAIASALAAAVAVLSLVVISGCGSRGVGLGVARQVLERDLEVEVVVLSRTLGAAPSISAELGPRAHGLQCDVTDDASCSALAAKLEKLGGHELLLSSTTRGLRLICLGFPVLGLQVLLHRRSPSTFSELNGSHVSSCSAPCCLRWPCRFYQLRRRPAQHAPNE